MNSRIFTSSLFVCAPTLLLAQLPPSAKLSPQDLEGYRAEVQRLERMRTIAPDPNMVDYAIARTHAAGEQWSEAIRVLDRVVHAGVGIDPGQDEIFNRIRNTGEFASLLAQVRSATPPVVASRPQRLVEVPQLVPEGIAHDGRTYYLGDTQRHRIVRCPVRGSCTDFVSAGSGEVLGMKVSLDRQSLWAAVNRDGESWLYRYDLASGRELEKYAVPRGPRQSHLFNDLAMGSDGVVYVTDTAAGAVYRLASGTLELFVDGLQAANGIATSQDGRTLYVSCFPDGIAVIDVAGKQRRPLLRPADLCLLTIDGLYAWGDSLIAIQNGYMAERVVRLDLAPDGLAVRSWRVLERRHPHYDSPTTGVLVGAFLDYMAHPQPDRKDSLHPTRILRLRLR